jgi:hypothetical protein
MFFCIPTGTLQPARDASIFALDKASIWRKPNVQENKRREKKRKSKENISRRAENT